ncbi:MAG: BatD family protein [Pseudomonadota bacterium]
MVTDHYTDTIRRAWRPIARGLNQRRPSTSGRIAALTLLITAILCSILTAEAQPSLRAEVVPRSGSTDDLFMFTVTVEGHSEKVTPQLSTSADFDVQLLGPRTAISIINGAVSSQQSVVYQLVPKRAGQLKTPEAQVVINGQTLSAAPISVSISGAQANDPGSQADPSPSSGKGQLFMNQTVTPQKVYLGQQILNSIGVYTQVNLAGVRIKDDTLDGFWQEVISEGQNSKRTIAGKEYSSVNISRALFPLRTGKLNIPAREAIAQVPVTKRGNPFGNLDPFGGDLFEELFQRTVIQERALRAEPIDVEVSALPPVPKELAQFLRGMTIVGDTSLNLTYSDSPIKVGETKKLTLRVTSAGHLNPLKTIPLAIPEGVKVYEGQPQVSHDKRTGNLITEKTFSYSLVPTKPGALRIPGPSLAYFDPESGNYKLATSSDATVLVSGSSQQSANVLSGVQQTSQPTPNNPNSIPTLPPVPVAPDLNYAEKSFITKLAERISIQLSLLFLAASILVVGLATALSKSRGTNGARRSAAAQVSGATELEALERAVREWLTASLPGARRGATFDELRALLSARPDGFSASLDLLTLLDDLELARYGASGKPSLDELKQRALKAIRG